MKSQRDMFRILAPHRAVQKVQHSAEKQAKEARHDPTNRFKEEQMLKRTFQLLLGAWLVAGTLWAAKDAFVGDWKLDPSRSKLTDEMKVERSEEHTSELQS